MATVSADAASTAQPRGPAGGRVACSGCGAPLDALRAGHVAIFDAQFHFFCDRENCRGRYLDARGVCEPAAPALAATALTPTLLEPVRRAPAAEPESVPERVEVDDHDELIEPLAPIEPGEEPQPEVGERRDVGLLLIALACIAGALTMALELAVHTPLVGAARLALVIVSTVSLGGAATASGRDPAEPSPLLSVAAPALASAVAGIALLDGGALAARAGFLAGTIVTVFAFNAWLLSMARRSAWAMRFQVQAALDVPAKRVAADANGDAPASAVAPGDQVLVEAGERVPVDLRIEEGEANVIPWPGAPTSARRRPGDVLIAGSEVLEGEIRGACLAVGLDRALARPILASARRPDVHAELVLGARRLAERGALAAAVIAGLVALATGAPSIQVGMIGVAVLAVFANPAVAMVPALVVARGVRQALRRGVIYQDAAAWESCSTVTAAMFCARGTLLRGEPELVEIEVFRPRGRAAAEPDEVLSLAAGALASERTPPSIALRRAARDKGLTPDPVRNARAHAEGGVTAVASTGEPLCVGGRALMMEQRVSVAAAEQTIYELESGGRTVILVAKAGRLMGMLALQDGLRSGARAAVQYLLDEGVEPILMSADTRETCEALGRSLDIDHLRPELAPDERAAAVERVRDGGGRVAVLGHTPYDDEALGAADAAIVLGAAGKTPEGYSVSLVSDDVRDAALALSLAHRTRASTVATTGLVLGAAGLGTVLVTAGLLPPEFAPLALGLGTAAAAAQIRFDERR